MKNYLAITTLSLLALSSTAQAETTFGMGIGAMYSGLGLNIGKRSSTALSYASLGCQGYSTGNENDAESTGSASTGSESNCGVGFGRISSAIFANNRHAFGLSVAVSHNTDLDQTEVRLRPGYYYFFKGIDQAGFNLGIGPSFYFDDSDKNDLDVNEETSFINIGYQF